MNSLENKLIELISKFDKNVIVIYLFGSQANGSATSQSDIDIAIFSKTKYSNETLFELKQTLELSLIKDVDVVDLKESDSIIGIRIIEEGKLILDTENYAAYLENKITNEYQDLQSDPFRKEQISDLKKRLNKNG